MFKSLASIGIERLPYGVKFLRSEQPCVFLKPHREFFHISPDSDSIESKPKEEQVKKFSNDNKIQALSDNLRTWSVID